MSFLLLSKLILPVVTYQSSIKSPNRIITYFSIQESEEVLTGIKNEILLISGWFIHFSTYFYHIYIYIYIYIYEDHTISFQTFLVWALLLTVHTWNSCPLPSNPLRLQCTCTFPTSSGRPHGSPLVWACQWPSSQPLSSPQLSHNDDNLWA